jgi:hypothetical protein
LDYDLPAKKKKEQGQIAGFAKKQKHFDMCALNVNQSKIIEQLLLKSNKS